MAKKSKKPQPTQADFHHTWYLQEWMNSKGKRQVDLVNELDWSKGKANEVWNGQQYTQALLDVLAPWLEVRPHELLMHPDEAHAILRMRRMVTDFAREDPLAAILSEVAPAKKAG